MDTMLIGFPTFPLVASAGAALVMLMTGTFTSADEHNRRWSASGAGAQVVAADCTECGDDIGMLISCKGASEPAVVAVHWAAVEQGKENAVLPIVLSIGGRAFERQATTILYGQIGYTPEFKVTVDDPLIEALQAGSKVQINFAGDTTTIELKGSRKALDQFGAQCGWEG